jgi:hypothetical protein
MILCMGVATELPTVDGGSTRLGIWLILGHPRPEAVANHYLPLAPTASRRPCAVSQAARLHEVAPVSASRFERLHSSAIGAISTLSGANDLVEIPQERLAFW